MGIFDRIGNLGKGVVGMWKRGDETPSAHDVLDAELDAAARKARVDAQLRRMREQRAPEPEPEVEPDTPAADVASESPDDRPIKKTL